MSSRLSTVFERSEVSKIAQLRVHSFGIQIDPCWFFILPVTHSPGRCILAVIHLRRDSIHSNS